MRRFHLMGRTDSIWRRATAQVLCVALLAVSIASGVHTSGDRDADCAILLVAAHDASAHSFRESSSLPDEHPLHCLACHWARSFRPCAETGSLTAPDDDPGARFLAEALPIPVSSTVAQPPLRSPPA